MFDLNNKNFTLYPTTAAPNPNFSNSTSQIGHRTTMTVEKQQHQQQQQQQQPQHFSPQSSFHGPRMLSATNEQALYFNGSASADAGAVGIPSATSPYIAQRDSGSNCEIGFQVNYDQSPFQAFNALSQQSHAHQSLLPLSGKNSAADVTEGHGKNNNNNNNNKSTLQSTQSSLSKRRDTDSAAPAALISPYAGEIQITSMPTSVPQQEPQQPTSPAAAPGTPAGSTTATEDVRKNQPIIQRNVYISGLPSYMQSHEFRELCQRFGRVEASKLCVEGPSNPTKGYGFVLYYSEESAAACIKELSGSYLNGRCLQARLADTHATPIVGVDATPAALHPPLPRERRGRRGNGRRHGNKANKNNNNNNNSSATTVATATASVSTTSGALTGAAESQTTPLMHPQIFQAPTQVLSPTPNMSTTTTTYVIHTNPISLSAGTYALPTTSLNGSTFAVSTNSNSSLNGGNLSLSAGNSVNGSTVYYTCAAPPSCSSGALGMPAYRISPMPNSAERQQVVLLQQPPQPQPQPQQTIVYAASPAYFTAAGGAPSGHATVQNASVGSQAHVLSPLMLSGNPSNGVQFISFAPTQGIFQFQN